MPSLRNIQQAFSMALTQGADGTIAPWLDEHTAAGRNALSVYRNNVREGFFGTLATTYPVLHRLVGPDYFRQLATTYQSRYPSQAGNLLYVGRMMPQFLQQEFGGTGFAYFVDVARLEWACQLALVAADSPCLDRSSLLAVDPAAYPMLRFSLHPSVQLLASIYPLFRTWRSNLPHSPDNELIDLNEGGDYLLVRRDVDSAEIRKLDIAQFEFLSALVTGTCLADAVLAAERTGTEFDLGINLEGWVAAGIIVGFSLDVHRG
jgi:hypothetical protein